MSILTKARQKQEAQALSSAIQIIKEYGGVMDALTLLIAMLNSQMLRCKLDQALQKEKSDKFVAVSEDLIDLSLLMLNKQSELEFKPKPRRQIMPQIRQPIKPPQKQTFWDRVKNFFLEPIEE